MKTYFFFAIKMFPKYRVYLLLGHIEWVETFRLKQKFLFRVFDRIKIRNKNKPTCIQNSLMEKQSEHWLSLFQTFLQVSKKACSLACASFSVLDLMNLGSCLVDKLFEYGFGANPSVMLFVVMLNRSVFLFLVGNFEVRLLDDKIRLFCKYRAVSTNKRLTPVET